MKIVNPHLKFSQKVLERDLPIVIKASLEMIKFCLTPPKNFQIILALGHSQIEEKDPLRFFVTSKKEVIINPEIYNHTRHTVDSLEGCVSFPHNLNIVVQRWNKCQVRFQTLDAGNELTPYLEQNISGQRAKMFQHEIDHFNAIYIYD